jgi:uncharacterized membrane protein HdeD (DUF308 family)
VQPVSIDPTLVGIGAAVLAGILSIVMPVSRRRVNQTIVSAIIVVLVFVAAFALFEPGLAIVLALGASVLIIGARFILGGVRSTLYHYVTRYTRRDYWQRRVGQAIIGGRRRNGR